MDVGRIEDKLAGAMDMLGQPLTRGDMVKFGWEYMLVEKVLSSWTVKIRLPGVPGKGMEIKSRFLLKLCRKPEEMEK